MMWHDHEEPLYDERVLGETVRFTWMQSKDGHAIRAQWLRGKNPWDILTTEGFNPVRSLAIKEATDKMEALISSTRR